MSQNSFGARGTLAVGGREYEVFRLDALRGRFDVGRLPFSLKVLLENLLRTEGEGAVSAADIEALAGWDPRAQPSREIAFSPARVLMQDFTGVPAVVDLAAMRDAMAQMGGDPAQINPLVPAELVIDHSVQVDAFGTREAFAINAQREFERNRERYAFLRWGQGAFDRFAVVPPDTGIVHQVNLEYLSQVVFVNDGAGPGSPPAAGSGPPGAIGRAGPTQVYPDTLVGTDSHTTMVNGLGVLGWGVGGIEAEAAMLGQPLSMLIPQVLSFRLHGALPEGATATDLVLTVTEMLRERGVVGMFVEFHGAGLATLPIADRATIGNMSPEFGSTCAIFPIDAETLRYLRFTGRPPERIELVEAYAREQGLWHDEDSPEPAFSDTLELDLGAVVPSLAGPKRPQDRVALTAARDSFRGALGGYVQDYDQRDEASAESFPSSDPPANGSDAAKPDDGGPSYVDEAASAAAPVGAAAAASAVAGSAASAVSGGPDAAAGSRAAARCTLADGSEVVLDHGHVVIAAITSCTNTSNPSVMIGAGILARNAVARGLRRKPWVKTSLAPGSKVVTEYLDRAQLTEPLERLGFNLVGYGCTTCIGNSGPLPDEVSSVVNERDLAVVSVLSGNRNFEGRINPDVKMNYLASPPLCVAYALAGTMDIDIVNEPLGRDERGAAVYLRDIWPTTHEVAQTIERAVQSDMFRRSYSEVFAGDERWRTLELPASPNGVDQDPARPAAGGAGRARSRFGWDESSTYVRLPPYFEGMPAEPERVDDVHGARVLALLGDSVTTDHISPAGSIKRDGPAGAYLQEQGVAPRDFNSYGSRRGNHEVMMRGTFANIRLRNLMAGGPDGETALPEGGFTFYLGLPGPLGSPGRTEGGPAGPGEPAATSEPMSIYDAAMRYAQDGVPLVVLGGREYGSGSSRDWAAKGTRLLGVRAVIAQSFERIHRSNLVGMGVLPLQFPDGESAQSLGLTGREVFSIEGLADAMNGGGGPPEEVSVTAERQADEPVRFRARVRIDTPREAEYFRHGGILQYVLRQLLAG
jgi:aconitate hydratase A / 2-methylisocitrate dehydratase